MAGEIKPQQLIVGISDDPGVAGITPTKYNAGSKLSGGTHRQLLERDTTADATTGMNLTSTPTVTSLILVSGTPAGTPAAGTMFMWADEVSGVVTLYIKKPDAGVVSLVFG